MTLRLLALSRALAIGAVFVSLWTWFVPRWIALGKGVSLEPQLSPAALVLLVVGGAIMIKCVWDFGWTGEGTPAPFDPPRKLVVRGLYRWVRNPMYIGMGLVMIALILMLPPIRRELITLVLALWVAVSLFVVFYEEPALRGLFGERYVEYCRHVRRWIPRLTPFDKADNAAVTSPGLE
jgi:protein-S-isoprenylcysteine O-methyltransferase Ste14